MRTAIANLMKAMAFGSGRSDRLRIGRFYLQTALNRRISAVPVPKPMRIALAPDKHAVVIADPGELAALGHIFSDVEYVVAGDPATIFDLGANVGLATLYFSRAFPAARIFSVEADPTTYARLCENVASLPNVTALNYAVTGTNGPVAFHSNPHSLWSALTPQSEDTVEIEVEGITLATLMSRMNISRIGLLKLDIEGAEFDVLRGEALRFVDEIIGEIHYDLAPGLDSDAIRNQLEGFTMTFVPQAAPGRFFLYAQRL